MISRWSSFACFAKPITNPNERFRNSVIPGTSWKNHIFYYPGNGLHLNRAGGISATVVSVSFHHLLEDHGSQPHSGGTFVLHTWRNISGPIAARPQ